ncbi:acyl carrier protein [Bacillus sp. AFS001701]|uniref:acyl carrier protein n=1 Tax=Bacillus sp. AFS001701 TaxID=2033480 RepID=UPI000BF3F9E0|nr:acyl carrier protein [Bacillus sp. AFS001701]PET57647.1 acyl carrier protein [Bacillus sp. AFS001701]
MITKELSLEVVTDTVLNILKEEACLDSINVNDTLKNLDIDSLTFAEVLSNLEDTLDVEIELDDSLFKQSDLSVEDFIINCVFCN